MTEKIRMNATFFEEFAPLKDKMAEAFDGPEDKPEIRVPFVRENPRTDIQVGMIAEDCSLHIGEVLECDPQSGDVRIKSMFDGQIRYCDLYHCGVVAQTPEEIELKTKLYREGGKEALTKHYEAWLQTLKD